MLIKLSEIFIDWYLYEQLTLNTIAIFVTKRLEIRASKSYSALLIGIPVTKRPKPKDWK